MFIHRSSIFHVFFLLGFQNICSTANHVAGINDESDWMNVGNCGVGLTCGPSCQLLCLKIHNYYRSLHRSPPLTCDNNLARSAQSWTDVQANQRKMFHSPWTDKYTESISWKSWGWPGMKVMKGAIPGAVRSWYTEIKNGYNYRTGKGDGRVVGHFRSVVWKSETKLGCGLRVVPGVGTFVTAHYAPASHATLQSLSLARINVLSRKGVDRYCHIRSSQRKLCGENFKAPFVTPQECLKNGCCYDDTFIYEPKVHFYEPEGKIWCYRRY